MTLFEQLASIVECNLKIEKLEEANDAAIDEFLTGISDKFRKVETDEEHRPWFSPNDLASQKKQGIETSARQQYSSDLVALHSTIHLINMYNEEVCVGVSDGKVHIFGGGTFYGGFDRDSASFPEEWVDMNVEALQARFDQNRVAAEAEHNVAKEIVEQRKNDVDWERYQELKRKFEGVA